MAANTYTQHYADGTIRKLRRSAKQGAPCKPAELHHQHRVILNMTDMEYQRFMEANTSGMSKSAFGVLMVFTGISKLNESNNC